MSAAITTGSYSLLRAAQACRHAASQHQVVLTSSAPAAAHSHVLPAGHDAPGRREGASQLVDAHIAAGGTGGFGGGQARNIIPALATTAPGDNTT